MKNKLIENQISLTKKQYLEIYKAIDFYELIKDWDKENGWKSQLLGFWKSLAEKFGMSKPIEIKKPENINDYKPDWTDKLSNQVWNFNEKHREDIFWDELALRLSHMIYDQRYQKGNYDDQVKWKLLDELEDQLLDEFEKYGLSRIKIEGIV